MTVSEKLITIDGDVGIPQSSTFLDGLSGLFSPVIVFTSDGINMAELDR